MQVMWSRGEQKETALQSNENQAPLTKQPGNHGRLAGAESIFTDSNPVIASFCSNLAIS